MCTASVESSVPPWLAGKGKGWITAEYNMLPGSTSPRKSRRTDGRSTEIQRLIGRSLRAVADLEALGEQMITVDCDVLEADGGTRTLSISGGLIALVDAVASLRGQLPDPARYPLRDSVAAISTGIVDGRAVLDLDYPEDSTAAVDMNVVMTQHGGFVEVQGTAEGAPFERDQMQAMLDLAEKGIQDLLLVQKQALGW